MIHSHKGRWAARVIDAELGLSLSTQGSLVTLWTQRVRFDLIFVMKYRGICNNKKTGPEFLQSSRFASKTKNTLSHVRSIVSGTHGLH